MQRQSTACLSGSYHRTSELTRRATTNVECIPFAWNTDHNRQFADLAFHSHVIDVEFSDTTGQLDATTGTSPTEETVMRLPVAAKPVPMIVSSSFNAISTGVIAWTTGVAARVYVTV